MKFLLYIFFIPLIHASFIQNQNKKVCANCRFFIPNKNECKQSGEMNLITGKYSYNDAIDVRKNETMCGENAVLFEENKFAFLYTIYDYCVNQNLLFFSFISFYIILYKLSKSIE